MSLYKAASQKLRQAVKAAKRWYRDKAETQLCESDRRCMWQGLQTITDYRGRTYIDADSSLVEDLNTCACFEASSMSTNTALWLALAQLKRVT